MELDREVGKEREGPRREGEIPREQKEVGRAMTLRDAGEIRRGRVSRTGRESEVLGCKILETVGQGDWRIWGCWWCRGEWLMQEVGGDRD